MAWIESHSVLIDHKKVREVARILQIRPVLVLGHLHCFWHKVIELREDGDITSWNEEDIAYYSKWEGDAKKLYEALKNRFIDEKNGLRLVHDWLDYAYRFLYAKYHTSNPKLLKQIEKKHKRIGQPKGYPKGVPLGKPKGPLPNLPNLPNHNNTPKGAGQPKGYPKGQPNQAEEIYELYRQEIKPGAETDAIRSIKRLLKEGITLQTLLDHIKAYKQFLIKGKSTDPQFFIQANNFFGRAGRWKEFELEKKKEPLLKEPDPNCKVCKGKGVIVKKIKVLHGERKIKETCQCRKIS